MITVPERNDITHFVIYLPPKVVSSGFRFSLEVSCTLPEGDTWALTIQNWLKDKQSW